MMNPARAALLILALLMSQPARADVWDYGQAECNQLWFMRNLIMDRAGYCFGSVLGQALFDNGNCLGQEVRPGAREAAQVGKIARLEAQIGCRVDTTRRNLDLHGMAALRRLGDMPLPDNGGSACTWAGAATQLADGYSGAARAIGRLERGDRIELGSLPEDGWLALHVAKPGGGLVIGWAPSAVLNLKQNCTDWAG